MHDSITAAPDWLGRALAQPGRSQWADVPGNRIHYLEWNGADGATPAAERPGLLLVHGFRAHAHWWDFIAPLLAADFRVLAMDMGGMGDSGYRSAYSHDLYADEIAGVLRHAQLRDATLIGHSFGGLMCIGVCHRYPRLVARAIVVDSRVSFADDDARHRGAPRREKKRFAGEREALERFRLVPDQGGVAAPLFAHVAHHSLKQQDGLWMWKFDDACATPDMPLPALTEGEMLERLSVPVDFVCGEHSAIVTPALAQRIGRTLRHGRGPIVIPDANHHVLLDQPLALTAALRALLATGKSWTPSFGC